MTDFALFINTRRDGYSPTQCGHTITVGELMELLEDYDESTPIYFKNDDGYTYGSIHDGDFNEEFYEID